MDRAEFRQRAMIAAMQGLLANTAYTNQKLSLSDVSKYAVACADALLEANTIDETEEQEA
jgi:hypothetical protein